jgi:hypothetical protein
MSRTLCRFAVAIALALPQAALAQDSNPLAPPPPNPPPSSPPPSSPTAGGANASSAVVGGGIVGQPSEVQKQAGFAFEGHIGTQFLTLAGGGTAINVGAVQGGFFAGYKIGRIIAGLGFDIERVASGTSGGMQPSTSRADTAIAFVPGVRVALVRSSDGRVELFAEADFGFGHAFHDDSTVMNPPDTSNFHFSYQLGPGLRYWLHPQFAIGGLVGVRGDFEFDSQTINTGMGSITTSTSSGITAIFANLQLLGVF